MNISSRSYLQPKTGVASELVAIVARNGWHPVLDALAHLAAEGGHRAFDRDHQNALIGGERQGKTTHFVTMASHLGDPTLLNAAKAVSGAPPTNMPKCQEKS